MAVATALLHYLPSSYHNPLSATMNTDPRSSPCDISVPEQQQRIDLQKGERLVISCVYLMFLFIECLCRSTNMDYIFSSASFAVLGDTLLSPIISYDVTCNANDCFTKQSGHLAGLSGLLPPKEHSSEDGEEIGLLDFSDLPPLTECPSEDEGIGLPDLSNSTILPLNAHSFADGEQIERWWASVASKRNPLDPFVLPFKQCSVADRDDSKHV